MVLAVLAMGGVRAAAAYAATPLSSCADCPELVMIPAGRFIMGAAAGEEDREGLGAAFRNRSTPAREVRVARFAMGRYEVTRAEYHRFVQATGHIAAGCFAWNGADFEFDTVRNWRNPGYPQHERHPAVCVSWEDADAYVRWLSGRTGQRYRLPSEAEWEYAARAGTVTARYWGEASDAVCLYANGADFTAARMLPAARVWGSAACDDGHAHTAPVGRLRPNAFGLYDMLGNAGEWTQDCWNADYRGAPMDAQARTDGDCAQRVVRGGAWDDAPIGLRAAYRVGSPVVIRLYSRGFRVALSP